MLVVVVKRQLQQKNGLGKIQEMWRVVAWK